MHHTLADLVHHQPSLLPGAGARQPSLHRGAGARQPSLLPGAGARQPSLLLGAGARQPSLLLGAGARQPSLLLGAGARQPSLQSEYVVEIARALQSSTVPKPSATRTHTTRTANGASLVQAALQ
eukprot:COSAG02_NODE_1361_length_13053_cov_26.443956_6_plen_124_part_00